MAFLRLGLILYFILFSVFQNNIQAAKTTEEDSILSKLDEAIVLNDKILQCQYTYNLASIYRFRGKTDLAVEYSQKAIRLAREVKDTSRLIHSLNILAVNLQQKGEIEPAKENFLESIELSKLSGDTILWANSVENMSILYGSTGTTDYPRALELLLLSAKLKEEKKAWEMLPGTYKNISTIFREIGDTINRENYLLKAVDLIDRGLVSNMSFSASVYNEAGRYFTDEKVNYERAASYFNKVLEISRKLNWKKGIAVSLSNLANVKELEGDYASALQIHNEALKLKEEMNDVYGLVNTYLSIGQVLKKQNSCKASVAYLEKACGLANANKMTNELKGSYYSLYEVNRGLNNFSLALENYEKFTALSDSINGLNHKKMVAELETKYQTEKKQQQIEQLTTEKQIETLKERQRLLMLSALIVIIALLAYFMVRQTRLKKQRVESELNQKLLRSQMNPHFIFNALGAIQNYIYENNADDAGNYLAKFAKLMRNILESSIHDEITIEQEVEIVKTYLLLQQIRDTNNFEFKVLVEGAQMDELIPPMLAQPFIENAILHGFVDRKKTGMLIVKYQFSENDIAISIEDDGIGIAHADHSKSNDHKSYAIQLTRERLNLLCKPIMKSNKISIIDLSETGKQGTRIEISINRNQKCTKP